MVPLASATGCEDISPGHWSPDMSISSDPFAARQQLRWDSEEHALSHTALCEETARTSRAITSAHAFLSGSTYDHCNDNHPNECRLSNRECRLTWSNGKSHSSFVALIKSLAFFKTRASFHSPLAGSEGTNGVRAPTQAPHHQRRSRDAPPAFGVRHRLPSAPDAHRNLPLRRRFPPPSLHLRPSGAATKSRLRAHRRACVLHLGSRARRPHLRRRRQRAQRLQLRRNAGTQL